MKQIAEIGTLLNEVFIEHHNSAVARRLVGNAASFQDIRDESVNVGRLRSLIRQVRNLFDIQSSGKALGLMEDRDTEKGVLKKAKSGNISNEDRPDSEVRKQVRRFEIGGKQWPLVEKLANEWFIPLMRNYATPTLGINDKTKEGRQFCHFFDNYRPLGTEQEDILLLHVAKLQSYVKSVAKKEENAISNSNNDGSPKEASTPLEPLDYFLSKQTIKKQLLPIHAIMSRIPESPMHIVPANKPCPLLKRDIIADIKEAVRNWCQSHAGDESNAIAKIKQMCRKPPLGGPQIELTKISNDLSLTARLKNLPSSKCSFKYAATRIDESIATDIMTELKWDNAKSFPYNVLSAATENEDESDGDNN
jgi:hypothetical protein